MSDSKGLTSMAKRQGGLRAKGQEGRRAIRKEGKAKGRKYFCQPRL